MKFSMNPEYYHTKYKLKLEKTMEPVPDVLVVKAPAPVSEVKEKKKPGRKRKVLPPKTPITRTETGIILSFE
jgi:hypothetical protein